VNNGFLVSMTVVTVFHAEYLRADLGTDFTADAAILVNSWCARHFFAPGELCCEMFLQFTVKEKSWLGDCRLF
jgi:hypothetical protein